MVSPTIVLSSGTGMLLRRHSSGQGLCRSMRPGYRALTRDLETASQYMMGETVNELFLLVTDGRQ